MIGRMNLRVHLVRHGETAWSLSGQHTGRTDIPLTARGEQRARNLAERLGAIPFTRVFCSPLGRARRTCELAGLGSEAELDPELVEWNYGAYEGLCTAEIHRDRPGWNLFRDGCPGGESPVEVSDRADGVISRLRTLEGNVAVFSHGHFGRILAARWIGLPPMDAQRFLLDPAALGILGYEHGSVTAPVIELWNDSLPEAAPGR